MILRWTKRILMGLGAIVFLAIAFLFFLHTSWGRNIVRKKAESFLSKTLQTHVSIGDVNYNLLHWVQFKTVVVLDQHYDTLFSGGKLYVNVSVFKLLFNRVATGSVELTDISVHVKRARADSSFNYEFLTRAFGNTPDKDNTTSFSQRSSAVRLDIRSVVLSNIYFSSDDNQQQKHQVAAIKYLRCSPGTLDLENNCFEIKELRADRPYFNSIDSSVARAAVSINSKNEEVKIREGNVNPTPFVFALSKLQIDNGYASYKKPLEKVFVETKIDQLITTGISFDLARQKVSCLEIGLDNSSFCLTESTPPKFSATGKKSVSSTSTNQNWTLAVDRMHLRNNALSYHNQGMKPAAGFDPNHIEATAINLLGKKVVYDGNGFSSRIDTLSFTVNDRFQLKSFRSDIKYADNQLEANDLALVYNNSVIRLTGSMWGPRNKISGKSSSCQIENIELSYKDILDLSPQLKELLPIALNPDDRVRLKGTVTGSMDDFTLDQIQLSSDQFQFSGKARIQNTNDRNGPAFYTTIRHLVVKKNLLSSSMLKRLEQQNISLPDKLIVSGTVYGNKNKISSSVRVNSSYGQLTIKGDAENFGVPDRMRYDMQLQARQLETGRWIKKEHTMGRMDGAIMLKGQGKNPTTMEATSDILIGSIFIKGYRYSNVRIGGIIDRGRISAATTISDPNLVAALRVTGSITGNYPTLSGSMSIDKADLKNLGFSPDSLTVSGLIKIDTLDADPAHLLASVTATSSVVNIRGRTVNVDTLSMRVHSGSGTELTVNAPFLQTSIKSSYPIDQLPQKLQDAVRQLSQDKVYSGEGNGWFKLRATISQDSLLSVFMPGLQLKQPVHVDGRLDNRVSDSSFRFNLIAPSMRYQNMAADSVAIRAFNSETGKIFSVTAAFVVSGNDSIYRPRLGASWKDSTLEFTASGKDNKQKESYSFGTTIGFHKNEILVSIPHDFVLNYNTWKVSSNNFLRIRKDGIIAQNFILSNNRQTISINTSNADTVSPLQIKTDSLDVGALLALAALADTSIMNGKLNVDLVVQQPIKSFPVFTGKAGLYHLAYQGNSIGDFEIQSQTKDDSLQLDGKLTGRNDLRLRGSILPKEKELRMDANVNKLDLSLLQVLLKEYVPRAYGFAKGELHVAGTIDQPRVNGTIRLDSTGFTIAELNTTYKIDKQQIVIDYPTIRFKEFAISDSAGNKLMVDGTVTAGGPAKYELDLHTKTRDFVALNAKQRPGSSIYGKAIIDVDAGIKGTSDQLAINGNIFLRQSSDVHYVVSTSKTYSKGSERIRFVDIDTVPMPGSETIAVKDSVKDRKQIQGIVYNMKLEISKEASFSILIDPTTRDEVMIKGEGQLMTGLQEDGSLGITGVYRLQSGYYNMNTQFLKGKFMLTQGSTISFNGNPYDAIADITTQYEVKTSTSGLLKTSKSDQAGASEKIPFLIVLMAKGPVSKPVLSFDIRQKDKMSGASSSLQTSIDYELAKLRNDEVAMNKQVFSLLVMNQFTVYSNETNMAESDLNPDVMLRQGMSQFISDAMNSVADGLIKGVDVNVNFQNYKDESKSSGNRTDVGVSLSKNMSDRLTLTVGKNFTTGENSQSYAKQADQYIPDVTARYRLSKDGRYYVKAYRKNEYDVVVEGYFAKTGVSFTMQMDFNKFKDLFTRTEKLQNP